MTVPGTGGPDVSVVVISFDDAARLPRAIRSIQRQTLRNLEIIVVDDASTDDTQSVVRALALADPRIRYEQLARNSGGCSAPRNRGVELARAPWLMFCDSDDEYERHACKNLLQAAERLDADVVCGTAERVDVASGRTRRWRPEVHDVERVSDGLAGFPELLYDTISVNKIYRRSLLEQNGIRFPEGLLFEDQLFTLEALAAARRVASIPEVVYRWHVDRLSNELSITLRRHEVRNVESRIEVNRRIDAFLDERGLGAVQRMKDLKFLRHDLYLYLSSMLEVDDETAQALIDRLVPYVSSLDLDPAWDVQPALRVAVYHLLVGHLEGIRSAMRFVKWASVVDAPIVGRDDREYWGCEHLDDGPVRSSRAAMDWLDVSDLGILRIPFTQRRYLHRIDSLDVSNGSVTATGTTIDYDASLSEDDRIELRILINGDRTALSIPAAWTGRAGIVRSWRASGVPADHLGRRLAAKDRGTIGLAVLRGTHENVTSARSPESQASRALLPFSGAARLTGPDALALGPQDNGTVGWRSVRVATWRNRLAALQAAWLRVPGARRLAVVAGLVRRDAVPALIQRVAALLPPRALAVYESDSGRTAAGNARSISAAMHAAHPGIAQAWSFRGDAARMPSHAEAVERLSLRHHWLLSRARWWIDDGTSPMGVRKHRGTSAVLTGTGVPVHRLGLDDPSVLVSRSAVREVRNRGARSRLLVAASPFDAGVSLAALAVRGEAAITGIARMDEALGVRARGPAAIAALRRDLDLPSDRRIMLYAPTLRQAEREPTAPPLDLEAWSQALGDRAYLLVHAQPGARFTVSTRLRYAVRDISDADDLSAFLAASDLVISDYSSIIGDAALAGLPVVMFQPDRATYVDRAHGLYRGDGQAGPEETSMAGLVGQLTRWLEDPDDWDAAHREARERFADARCGPRDGRSAERAVTAILATAARPAAADGATT